MERKTKCPKCGAENLSWRSRCQQCGEELHKGESSIPKFEKRGCGFWVPLLLALIGIVFFGLSIFAEGNFYLLGLLALPIIGLVLAWKKHLFGGIILILSSLISLIYLFAVLIPNNRSDVFLFIGVIVFIVLIIIPLLTSGIFFLISV